MDGGHLPAGAARDRQHLINAYDGVFGIGINIITLPLVTVGLGFGIDYGLYIVSRTIEEFRVKPRPRRGDAEAVSTSGKAVTFTAVTMVFSTLVWRFSTSASTP